MLHVDLAPHTTIRTNVSAVRIFVTLRNGSIRTAATNKGSHCLFTEQMHVLLTHRQIDLTQQIACLRATDCKIIARLVITIIMMMKSGKNEKIPKRNVR